MLYRLLYEFWEQPMREQVLLSLIIYNQLHILFSAELFDKISRQLYFYLVRCVSKCQPGYIGLNCTRICPYPSYGERCQGYCECSNETCDISTGCRSLNTPTTGLYIFDVCFLILLHTTMKMDCIDIYIPQIHFWCRTPRSLFWVR